MISEQTAIRLLLIGNKSLEDQLLLQRFEQEGYSILALEPHAILSKNMNDFRPHLVLFNIEKPNPDNYRLLQQIRQQDAWLHVPLIVISSLAFQSDLQQAMNLGANRYLVKPFDFKDLNQVVQEEVQNLIVFPQ